MNGFLLAAAGLAVLLAAAHSYLGERHILIPLLRRNDLPNVFGGAQFTKYTLRVAWHITTVLAVGLACMLAALSTPDGVSAARQAHIISATSAASAVLALVGSRGRHLSWIVFTVIAALSWFAYP